MSHKANDEWIEAAQENFREATNNREWDLARAVAEDVRGAGFTGESDLMLDELTDKLPSFAHGYILGFLRKKNEEYKAKGLIPTLDLLIEDLTN